MATQVFFSVCSQCPFMQPLALLYRLGAIGIWRKYKMSIKRTERSLLLEILRPVPIGLRTWWSRHDSRMPPIFCPFSGLELMLKARLWPDPVSLGGDVRLGPPCFYDHCVRRSSRGRLLCLSDRGLLAQLPLKSKLCYLMREVPVSGIC